jgi:peroxiredoxin
MKKACFIPVIAVLLLSAAAPALDTQIRPASVMSPMPDFTLPSFQGEEVILSGLKGKNVMLILPRGLAGENHWCHVCNYQYAELAEMEKSRGIRAEHNLEILFLLPYGKEMVQDWVDTFPAQMRDIDGWKNPGDLQSLDDRGKRRLDMAKRYFPKTFLYEKGEVPLPFPLLVDADRSVSKGLGLFTTEWGGSKIDQNIPTIFIIDKEGVVRFKYISQNTFDRPGPDYLLDFIGYINSGR